MNAWWTPEQASLWFGSLGGLVGACGALLGTVLGVFGPRGKGKAFALGLQATLIVLGVIGLAVGMVALVGGQPYHVWYPLLLLGAITVVVLGCLLPVTLSVYRAAEARKLDAEEFRRAGGT